MGNITMKKQIIENKEQQNTKINHRKRKFDEMNEIYVDTSYDDADVLNKPILLRTFATTSSTNS